MITITGFRTAVNKATGVAFQSLILSGTPIGVTSANGNVRFDNPRTSVPTTLTVAECEAAVGQHVDGAIERVQVAPFQFVNAAGETITATSRWQYKPAAKVAAKAVAPKAIASELVS
jgi:hypothetical protein